MSVLDSISGVVPAVEIRSSVSPALRVETKPAGGPASALLSFLKPSITVYGADGATVLTTVNPYGEADDMERARNLALLAVAVAGFLAVAFLAGRWTK